MKKTIGRIACILLEQEQERLFNSFDEDQRKMINEIREIDDCYQQIARGGDRITCSDIEFYLKRHGFSKLMKPLKESLKNESSKQRS